MKMANHDESDLQSDIYLQMDHWEEELSPAQQTFYTQAENEALAITSKINDLIKNQGGEILESGQDVLVVQTSGGNPALSVLNNFLTPPQSTAQKNRGSVRQTHSPNLQAIPSQSLVVPRGAVQTSGRTTRSGCDTTQPFPHPQGTYQLVMGSGLGLLVGAVQNQSTSTGPVIQANTLQSVQTVPVQSVPSTRGHSGSRSILASKPSGAPGTAANTATPSTTSTPQTAPTATATTTSATAPSTANNSGSAYLVKSKTTTVNSASLSAQTIPASVIRPTENSSIGGLSTGTSQKSKKTAEESRPSNLPDSHEVTFNKMTGKTFPSLVVVAKPYLRCKDMKQTTVNQERAALDAKVKSVLMYTPTKFTEWLIQQGLVRSEQCCSVHSKPNSPVKLKLGMYSDVSKFQYSGGYVWISECCPQKFVSVFSGSIFEGAPHPPAILLKLIYHWCCQTNVQNVVQWVKVDNFYVKNFYTHMRSICVAAVNENYEKLGGSQKRVEVGVISLGTTSQDGNMRQVKVEVLGIMDPESKMVRLRAVEPLQQDGERNYKRRFVKILEPMEQWVDKQSIILTDFTVDKVTLHNMGFSQVYQSTIPDTPNPANKLSNQNIMEYLRKIVPRMFQNTLSLLSRQIIQQFLDELVWRERWGPVPAQAFDSIVAHLSAQTKLDSGESLVVKLFKIAGNPFRKWEYDKWKSNGNSTYSSTPVSSSGTNNATLAQSAPAKSITPSPVQWAGSAVELNDEPVLESDSSQQDPKTDVRIVVYRPFEDKGGEDIDKHLALALDAMDKGKSLRKAVSSFSVPRSLLLERAKCILKTKAASGQRVFTDDEESDIVDHLITLSDWGYPFGRWDIRLVVKQYLDSCGRIEPRFKDNAPGDMWIEKFLARHQSVRDKLCRNIPSRGTFIDAETVKNYMSKLSQALQDVPAENILNFMEVGLTGDPLKSLTVELRDLRYPVGRRKSKSAAAMILACSALGNFLPAYIVFEGRPVIVTKGPSPGEYTGTKSGWFDENTFGQWIETVLLPWADTCKGRKVVIGDSLAQLFTVKSLAMCIEKGITFVCMPCNVTNILSPIDSTLYQKLKLGWRTVIRAWWAINGDKPVYIKEFPQHINKLLCTTITPELSELLQSSFKSVGVYPSDSSAAMTALERGGVQLDKVGDTNPNKSEQNKMHSRGRKRVASVNDDKRTRKSNHDSDVNEVTIDEDEIEQVEGEKLAAIEAALTNATKLVSLESYYYGTKEADADLLQKEFRTSSLNAKCPKCQKFVATNLELMKHILGHSEDDTVNEDMNSLIQCKYCVKTLPSEEELNQHINETHKLSSHDSCLICQEKFTNKASLILHMHQTHTQLELPYSCSICLFRSSEQYKLVDHFYDAHANAEKIQCPFCLKCVAISNNGKKMPANTFFFMHHVFKHQAKSSSRKCDKCALWFVHKGILKEHQMKEHLSCTGDYFVIPYSANGLMMPSPIQSSDSKQTSLSSSTFINKKFDTIQINSLDSHSSCLECKTNGISKDHFMDLFSCTRCRFSSFCNKAVLKHTQDFHCKDRPSTAHPSSRLHEEMFCVCGFSSNDGNQLAAHLVLCKQRSAYPSEASALRAGSQSASFPTLVTLDEGESKGRNPVEEWSKTFSSRNELSESHRKISRNLEKQPQSMLNLLGLVHKTSSEEVSEKDSSVCDIDDESSRERPLSRASSTRSTSSSKRTADDARLDSIELPSGKITLQGTGGSILRSEIDPGNGVTSKQVRKA